MPPLTLILTRISTILVALGLMCCAAGALTYVGSWRVDAGKSYLKYPLAYTGQEAAALLFGGLPSDYHISTVGKDPAKIDNMAWYSVLGVTGGKKLRQNYDVSRAGGLYYDGKPYDNTLAGNPASAYVRDNAYGVLYTNYAFRIDPIVPDPLPLSTPASLPVMAGGFGVLLLLGRVGRSAARETM